MTESMDIDYFQKIIKKLESKVEYADIRVRNSKNNSITLKDGKIDNVDTGINYEIGIRVLQNGAWGSAFTSEIDKVEQAAQNATTIANQLQSDVQLSPTNPEEDNVKSQAKIKIDDISIDEKIELLKEVEKIAQVDQIQSTSLSFSEGESTNLILSSEGTQILSNNNRTIMAMNAVASDGNTMQFGHKSLGGVNGFEVIQDEDLESFATGISQKAIGLLDAKTAPSGDYPVILDPELAGVFIHEALGHASEADIILQNDSILKDKLGQKIGSDLVTVIDDASIETGFGYYPYDVEGIKSEKTVLVEDGIFKNVLSSRETASKVGNEDSSGNARSSVSDKPLVRMSNTYIKPGDSTFEELIEDIPNGIYLKGSRGGQVDTGRGIFQFNAVEAYNIEHGELTTHLRDVSLSGTTLDILNNITGVGSDFKLNNGFCGKDGQTVPVGDGGPHIRVSRATVGGAQ